MNDRFYAPPEVVVAAVSVALIVVSATTLWLLHRIDQAVTLPGGAP